MEIWCWKVRAREVRDLETPRCLATMFESIAF